MTGRKILPPRYECYQAAAGGQQQRLAMVFERCPAKRHGGLPMERQGSVTRLRDSRRSPSCRASSCPSTQSLRPAATISSFSACARGEWNRSLGDSPGSKWFSCCSRIPKYSKPQTTSGTRCLRAGDIRPAQFSSYRQKCSMVNAKPCQTWTEAPLVAGPPTGRRRAPAHEVILLPVAFPYPAVPVNSRRRLERCRHSPHRL